MLKDFLQKMTDSGYYHRARVEVTRSATVKFYRQVMIQESGGKRIYRSLADMKKSRRLRSLTKKMWYKSRRGGTNIKLNKYFP